MAILNYADTLKEIEGYIHAASGTEHYLKLAFTGDGHIITHGIDYTPDFEPGKRGLVSANAGTINDFLRINNTWLPITVADLPVSTSLTDNIDDEHIPTNKAVSDYVGGFIKAAETLKFVGVINYIDGKYQVVSNGETKEGFPEFCEVGDSYRVGNISGNITIAGEICEPGDIIICIKRNDDSNVPINNSDYWSVILTNINGTKQVTINGEDYYFHATTPNPVTFFAPLTLGGKGNLLISTGGKTPQWGNISFIDGNLIVTDENSTILLLLPVIANNVLNTLSAGMGLSIDTTTYDGSLASILSITKATNDTLGGFKVDTDHGFNNTPTVSMDIDGTLYITAENIANALGYDVASAYQIVNSLKEGLAPRLTNTNGMVNSDYYVLASQYGTNTPDWYLLPMSVFQDTWRDIQIDKASIEDKILNINATDDVYVIATKSEDYVDLSFGISWFNISANGGRGAYEKY